MGRQLTPVVLAALLDRMGSTNAERDSLGHGEAEDVPSLLDVSSGPIDHSLRGTDSVCGNVPIAERELRGCQLRIGAIPRRNGLHHSEEGPGGVSGVGHVKRPRNNPGLDGPDQKILDLTALGAIAAAQLCRQEPGLGVEVRQHDPIRHKQNDGPDEREKPFLWSVAGSFQGRPASLDQVLDASV